MLRTRVTTFEGLPYSPVSHELLFIIVKPRTVIDIVRIVVSLTFHFDVKLDITEDAKQWVRNAPPPSSVGPREDL